jgi:hypothetical protein
MIRQYHAQRRRGGPNPLGVGVIPAGAIFYLQDEGWWRDRYRGAPTCRNPWIVEAFLNGTIGAARRNRETGLWEDVHAAGRSDMALVRSLRDGRRRQVAVRTLILHEEHGLSLGPCRYPDLPDMRLWRLSGPASHALDRRAGPGGSQCNEQRRRETGGDDPGGVEGKRQETAAASPSAAARVRRAARSRAPAPCSDTGAHALAPSGRDAARGRGLPEQQGG